MIHSTPFSMGNTPNFKHIKVSLFALQVLLGGINGFSQSWLKVDSLVVNQEIAAFAIDQNEMLYLGMKNGNILHLDANGTQPQLFSAINYSSVTTIEAWNRLKVFLFYRDNQVIVFLDRFSTFTNEYQLSSLNIGFCQLATPGVDNSFWVLESNNNELRKYTTNGTLLFSTPLGGLDLEGASHMRAFKNLLIILDSKNGFFFFDQFGNEVSRIPLSGATYFQVHKNNIITYDGNSVVQFDPFRPGSISKTEGPDGRFRGVVKNETDYFFVGNDRIFRMTVK